MSANFNSSWTILLGTERILIGQPGQAKVPMFENSTATALSQQQVLEKGLHQLREHLPTNGLAAKGFRRFAQKGKISVILDTTWVRLFVCRWDVGLRTVADFRRYCAIEFERRFHQNVKQWTLQEDRMLPGKESLICAYQTGTLEQVRGWARDANITLLSILPAFLCELGSAMSQSKARRAMYIDSAASANILAWTENGRVRDLLVSHANPRSDPQVLAQFADLFCARTSSPSPEDIAVISPTGDRKAIYDKLLVNAGITFDTQVLKLEHDKHARSKINDYEASS